MPLFMDIHDIGEVDPDALASAHQRDVEVGAKVGVNYQRYWFNPHQGRVFCLVEAPDADAAIAVHREAHGLLADEVIEVEEGH